VLGVVYLLVGLIGFAVTGFGDFATYESNEKVIFFEVNGLANVVHLAVGALLLFSAMKSVAAAKGSNVLGGAIYLALGIIGLFILDSDLNILSLNGPDNVLHLASAAVLLGVGLSMDKNVRRDSPING